MWQVFGLLSDNVWKIGGNHTTLPFSTTLFFALFTGIGDAIGVCLGHLLLTGFETFVLKLPFSGWRIFLQVAFVLSCGACLSGGTWQFITDGCIDSQYNFNLALLLVGTTCGSCFFVGITVGRAIVGLPRSTWKDFTLSIACGWGSGFFVGTDSRYPNNWLSPAVGQRTGDHQLDIFKAGLSVFIGFLCAQCVLVFVLQRGWLWTDDNEVCIVKVVGVDKQKKSKRRRSQSFCTGMAVRRARLEDRDPDERTRLSAQNFSALSEQSLLDTA